MTRSLKAFALKKGGRLLKPRKFSELSKEERAEVLTDPIYKKYESQLRAGDWAFVKNSKGWVKI
jgi:hypothetical protein